MLRTLCKTLDPADYAELGDYPALFAEMRGRVNGRVDHEHRAWEYGIALEALRRAEARTVLDIGGAESLFAPMAASVGFAVTAIDPRLTVHAATRQGAMIGRSIRAEMGDALTADLPAVDAVCCLSVIEHVAEEAAFWARVLACAGRVIVLTTDYSNDGLPRCPHHLRTYNAAALERLASRASGWRTVGKPDWRERGAHVNGYTFASLCLERRRWLI